MRDRLFALLGIEPGEESLVSMLLTQSVFLGIFFGAFDISAHSLFLSIFDEKMMARGYVVSGIAGIILTSLYTWLQTKLKFRNFAIINLVTVTVLTLLLWTGLLFFSGRWIIFFVFIMLGPLNILAMLGFWGTTGRLFSLRQGKRLFGLVDSGLVVGIIISCYTIPVLLSLKFESHNILLISSLSVLIAALIQILIGARFTFSTGGNEKSDEGKPKKSVMSILRSDRYTRIMAVFVALSVMTAFFVQYSFMAVTREQYPAEEDMARFLGIFTGSMMIFTLLIKLFVFSYLIRNYGLKACLVISPVLMAVFTAVAITIGVTMGYTPESASGFMIFFLVLAISRLFSKSFKDSIESPSFKVIYQTIDERHRYEVQSGMDGTVNEISALTSGLLLAGLGIISFVRLIHFPVVLFIIILTWISVSFILYSEYRKSIRKALEEISPAGSSHEEDATETDTKKRYSADLSFRIEYFRLATGDYSSIDNNRNTRYFEKILEDSRSKHDKNLLGALKRISSRSDIGDELRKKCINTISGLESYKSPEGEDRSQHARNLLAENRVPNTTEILRLLRDNSTESKRLGIYIIGKFRLNDMLPEVCECLNNPSLESDAYSVLSSFGADAVKELIRFYMVSSGNTATGKIVLRLLGKAQTRESLEFLFARLWTNSREIRETAVRCLNESDYRPLDEEKDRLHQLISEIAGLITWNISARVCLVKNNDQFLLPRINYEISRWKSFLFSLLKVIYDPGSINKIQENLEKETVESVNFALEMIDIVIDETIKPKLVALLDVIPDEAKLKNLYHFFPGEIPSYHKLCEDLLNRDYNLVSLWTKACTLHNLKEIAGETMRESAIALLFSPEQLIREESVRLMSRSGLNIYDSVSRRIPDLVRERLDRVMAEDINNRDLNFEKLVFLSKCFNGIPEEELLNLSESLIYAEVNGNRKNLAAGNYIIWAVNADECADRVIIRYDQQDETVNVDAEDINACYLLPLTSVEEFRNNNPERFTEILKYIDNNEEF